MPLELILLSFDVENKKKKLSLTKNVLFTSSKIYSLILIIIFLKKIFIST